MGSSTKELSSKLDYDGKRVSVPAGHAITLITEIFHNIGCDVNAASTVAQHLVDTSLCGMESHGVMRTLQYAEQMQTGYLNPHAQPWLDTSDPANEFVDGDGGIGIPAMQLAYERVIIRARELGISSISVLNTGHSGRLGAFAEQAAEKGFFTICIGGGNRKSWRQVAPHGGARAMLPTNPWCIGLPGGELGPVVVDFATSKIAGGWVYAARSAGARLPEDCLIDRDGNPTQDPEDYFNGGAILPAGGHKGYSLALIGELIAEALLGPIKTESNWLVIAFDTTKLRAGTQFESAAEEVLEELRNCPPAPGFERVEIPGERERNHSQASNGRVAVPERTWRQICDLHDRLAQAHSSPVWVSPSCAGGYYPEIM
ncbi:MAG: Ldh family oxidoreductase [Acidiferrobacterales bacterium]|nr:Ldh family oxidoreductase [Acidiferrobacterales bacterium]